MPNIEQVLDDIRINQGIILTKLNKSSSSRKLQDYEFYGPVRKIATVYDPGFNRFKCHYTGKHYGASLAAIAYLANKRGYSLVGTNKHPTMRFL